MSGPLAALREVWAEAPLKNTVTVPGLSAFVGYGGSNYYVRGGERRPPYCYTRATVCKTHRPVKSGKFADGRYQVQGRNYLVSADAGKLAGQELVGRRFRAAYYPPDPTTYVLLLGAPGRAGLAAAPPDGWVPPPVSITE